MRIIIEIDETNIGTKTTVITPSTSSDGNQNDTSINNQAPLAEDVGAGPSMEIVESENELNSDEENQTSTNIADAGMAQETDVQI